MFASAVVKKFPRWRLISLALFNLACGNALIRFFLPPHPHWHKGAGVHFTFTLAGGALLLWAVRHFSRQPAFKDRVWGAFVFTSGTTLLALYLLGVSLKVWSCLSGVCLPAEVWVDPLRDALRIVFFRPYLWAPLILVNFLLLRD